MRNSKNISELNNCFMKIFAYVLHLKRTCAFESPSLDEVYKQTRSLFNNSAELAIGLGIDIRKYDKARYAVCAWTDEMLLTMSWLYKRQWLGLTLQQEIYGTSNANIAFYARLNALQTDEYAVREIFLYCLYLGFCGQYRLESDKPLLRQLKLSHLILLVDRKNLINSLQDSSIFKDAYPVYAPELCVPEIIGPELSIPRLFITIKWPLAQNSPRTIVMRNRLRRFTRKNRLSLSFSHRSFNGKQNHYQNNCKNELQFKVTEFNRQLNSNIAQVKKTLQKNWTCKFGEKKAWYIVIGDKGQGKTSLLQASEALYPVVDNSVNSKVVGVDSPGFWLMRDSVILDTPGELIEHHNEEHAILWWNLIKQIKRFRNKSVFSGIILCISAETLRDCNLADLQQKGDNIRRRLNELSAILNIQYPVYVLVTQCNKLDEQENFFKSFPVVTIKQAMGKLCQIPHIEKQLKDVIGDTLHYIYEQLNILRLLSLRHKDYLTKAERGLFFPEKLNLLKRGLITILQPVFRNDPDINESRHAHLRGVFFTGVNARAEKDESNFNKKSGYFLQELFTVILPGDKYLFTPATRNMRPGLDE